VYLQAIKDLVGPNNSWIWKAKVHLKIKIFMWQLCYDAILTRDNLKKGIGRDLIFAHFVIIYCEKCKAYVLFSCYCNSDLGGVLVLVLELIVVLLIGGRLWLGCVPI
jgi:hypothetical protein